MNSPQFSIGIVGGTGYTGVELLRLLAGHPQVTVTAVTSRAEAGRVVSEIYPNLRGHYDLAFSEPDVDQLSECDLVFYATPNGTAMQQTPELLANHTKVIDLAADFRLQDLDVWSDYYGMQHSCPDLVKEAVYGLPEINREAIRTARLIANPGCYPTASGLGLLPLVEQSGMERNLTELSFIADCKSGISGAGRGTSLGTQLSEAGESFSAYAASKHRHEPEIKQTLATAAKQPVELTFVPHLLPIIRGIHATLYATTDLDADSLQDMYTTRYADEPFVDVLPLGSHPQTRSVKGANVCRIALHKRERSKQLVVLSVIDNLTKGAAGQAIQNMNLMLGLEETLGLQHPGLLP